MKLYPGQQMCSPGRFAIGPDAGTGWPWIVDCRTVPCRLDATDDVSEMPDGAGLAETVT